MSLNKVILIIALAGALPGCGNSQSNSESPTAAEMQTPMGPPLSKASESPELLDEYPCGNGDKKVEICHVPPGNPDNRHTLCIARSAVQKHIEHGHLTYGDFLGACDSESGGDGGADDGSGGSDDGSGGEAGGGSNGGGNPPCDTCNL